METAPRLYHSSSTPYLVTEMFFLVLDAEMFVLVLDAPDEPTGAADKSDVPAAPTRPRSSIADFLRAAHHDGPTRRQSSLSLAASAAVAVARGSGVYVATGLPCPWRLTPPTQAVKPCCATVRQLWFGRNLKPQWPCMAWYAAMGDHATCQPPEAQTPGRPRQAT